MGKYILQQDPLMYMKNKSGGGSSNKIKSKNRDVYTKIARSPTQSKHKYVEEHAKFKTEFNKVCEGYPYTPAILAAVPRIVVLGDIHGDYELAINLLKLSKTIKIENNRVIWIGETSIILQVGDQVDSCRPFGHLGCENPKTTLNDESFDTKILRLFTDLDIQARNSGGMVISLFGNHELMNSMGQLGYVSLENMNEFKDYKDPNDPTRKFKSPEEARYWAFSPGNEYGKFLGCTRLPAVIIGSNLFVHAGIVNKLMEILKIDSRNDLESINITIKKWLLGLVDQNYVADIIMSNRYSMFWTRILGSIPPNVSMENDLCHTHIDKVLSIFKVNNIIIGHTPTSFMHSSGINSTCDNKVTRVDVGSAKCFNLFDKQYKETGHVTKSREPQVLEIINDTTFNVLR